MKNCSSCGNIKDDLCKLHGWKIDEPDGYSCLDYTSKTEVKRENDQEHKKDAKPAYKNNREKRRRRRERTIRDERKAD